MKSSTFQLLQSPSVIILSAGHGAGDPGAVNGQHREADQTITLVDIMAAHYRTWRIPCVIVPHALGLTGGINWVNERFKFGSAWCLEIHRDSASGLAMHDASLRCGIYHGKSEGSKSIASNIRTGLVRRGAGIKTWARPDTESRHGSLAWIRQTKPLAHLLELGFMEGDNSSRHLANLGLWAASATAEAFTGSKPLT